MKRRRIRLQNRILFLVLVAVAPAWLVTAIFLFNWDASVGLRSSVLIVVTAIALAVGFSARQRIVRPLRSLANMLEALREGDYSMRGLNVDPEDALGEVMLEVNTLSNTLYDQRLEALEAGLLLQKVVADVDIAVFAFDADGGLRMVNQAAAMLFNDERADLRGKSADELGLRSMLEESSGRIVSHVFPARAGRWEVRRRQFREGGRPQDLLVITDVSRALREEERLAWQRLVRVIGHELNSSLTPIKSMAGTVLKLLSREPPPDDWRKDARAGLEIIRDRAESLARFMDAYARLARLPPPSRRNVDFSAMVRRAAALHGDVVAVEGGPEIRLDIDGDQVEQVMINLIKNAVEAVTDSGGRVRVRWSDVDNQLTVYVEDDGPGLASTDNLWVPFFTTKPGGTGLGLALSREIIENHGGSIALANRPDAPGCIASVTLPLSA